MKTIAIAGKGGTGKSTIASLIIRWLSENITKSILAVDADANTNLNDLLGVEISSTIGAIREEMKGRMNSLPGGMTKQQFFEYKIHESLVETKSFDIIAMGCPEGPGCYCYANNLLREIVSSLVRNYDIVVVDNAAGMEHFSRRTTEDIDYLLIVSDPNVRGVRAAGNIKRLVKDLNTKVKEQHLILNRVKNSIVPAVSEIIKNEGLQLLSSVPEDDRLLKTDQEGEAIWDTMANLQAYEAIGDFMKKLNIKGPL